MKIRYDEDLNLGLGIVFDMNDQLFASSGFVPDALLESPCGEGLLLSELPPFLRTLLTADGTVTKSLESFFWEAVSVEAIQQSEEKVSADETYYVDVEPDEDILFRNVELRGVSSNKKYLEAHSVFAVKHLPKNIFLQLKSKNIGIGELLRECGLETYRKIVAMGLSPQNRTAEERSIWRVYLIFIKGKAAIQIKEVFPLHVFQST